MLLYPQFINTKAMARVAVTKGRFAVSSLCDDGNADNSRDSRDIPLVYRSINLASLHHAQSEDSTVTLQSSPNSSPSFKPQVRRYHRTSTWNKPTQPLRNKQVQNDPSVFDLAHCASQLNNNITDMLETHKRMMMTILSDGDETPPAFDIQKQLETLARQNSELMSENRELRKLMKRVD
ncbi:unnamed protein product [Blepharisma stoltei]|uniref:Uncharacterized protein n=1 Tax=Blepharisma stoltei TaxID=1481888 RepID=A0AAU9JLR6_9CILI|nr:unnamed protein product [Blepharisma stoltei]